MLRSSLLLAAILVAGCVYRPVPDRSALSAADAELMDCERVAPTGTRLGTVVCLTPEEKAALAEQGRDQLERMQKSARGATKDPP